MLIKEAKKIIISLSQPDKMPGYAYGLPAWECKTGGKLAKVPGSVCFGCYAMKGNGPALGGCDGHSNKLTSRE